MRSFVVVFIIIFILTLNMTGLLADVEPFALRLATEIVAGAAIGLAVGLGFRYFRRLNRSERAG
jgi:NhaP-type Na+/H+ or K+/H+ antiporter